MKRFREFLIDLVNNIIANLAATLIVMLASMMLAGAGLSLAANPWLAKRLPLLRPRSA